MHGFFYERRCRLLPSVLLPIGILIFWQNAMAGSGSHFSTETAGFAVKFKDEVSSYRILGVFVLPRETLALEVQEEAPTHHQYVLKAAAGKATPFTANKWQWQAPQETGLYPVRIVRTPSADSVVLNIFVMIPYERLRGEYLNGYRIGKYSSVPLQQLSVYKPPRGFVEVTQENQEALIAPHFKLKQFLCKQNGDYPKYVVLSERLLMKLELILEQVNEKGYRCDTFHIMSGYRTPHYNKAIGNVKYSRHVYGSAADIFIDVNPPDGMMDDLNGDGKSDHHDAAILHDIIDAMYGKPWNSRFIGGLAKYAKTASHGPFVHVDVRGFRARWGGNEAAVNQLQ